MDQRDARHVPYFETPVKYSKLYLNQILRYKDFEIILMQFYSTSP